jgi:hypothetical protein
MIAALVFMLAGFSAAHAHEPIPIGKDCAVALESRLPVNWNEAWLKDQSELKKLWGEQDSHPLWHEWARAENRMKAIEAALKTMTTTERSYFQPIEAAARAALTKHQLVFVKERDLRHLDLPRHLAILRAIAAFHPSEARFSLYKIKRAVEGRYSVREYVDCRL